MSFYVKKGRILTNLVSFIFEGHIMFRKIYINNFRGIDNLEIERLGRVSVLTGKNNVGKSTILEALFLLFGYKNPFTFQQINLIRGNEALYDNESLFEPLFYHFDTTNEIKISVDGDDSNESLQISKDSKYVFAEDSISYQTDYKENYSLKYKYIYNDFYEEGNYGVNKAGLLRNSNAHGDNNLTSLREVRCCYINSHIAKMEKQLIDWIGKLEVRNKKDVLIKAINSIIPEVRDAFVTVINGRGRLYLKTLTDIVPYSMVGDGTEKLLYIVLSMMANPGIIILLDEAENGIHYSIMEKMWDVIYRVAEDTKSQIIATTHSLECIKYLHAAMNDKNAADISVHRIEKEENFKAFRFGTEDIELI